MALEPLSIALIPDAAVTNGGDGSPPAEDGGDDGVRAPRLPRWTRHEILVLILGKRAADNRVRPGRASGSGQVQAEPKWASVSSYCKNHGVNRGPVQCRKRWSNLAGDYKRIKEWESQVRDEAESFWAMRNDLRRERKLPGFFDREVYDMLEGGTAAASAAAETEAVFDSGRSAAAEDGLFSDFEQTTREEEGGGPEKYFVPAEVGYTPATVPISGAMHRTEQTSNPEMGTEAISDEGRKRKRLSADGDKETNSTIQYQLMEVLERNGRMLSTQLEAQNNNFHLDREQRKDHVDSLVAVLDKLAGALGRIADKL
ncbi:trihelix transcription factor ASR3-like [Actinidia eriantha]|uniref:trihelix transcription factor ASR3-like n=1 Tax=Actinidia eriantha TaxID=165200 RepID=UPI00258F0A93|nr:trihelix transcription factor ASR3-like [Actinidia eriantha]